jgi:hypothetical protein
MKIGVGCYNSPERRHTRMEILYEENVINVQVRYDIFKKGDPFDGNDSTTFTTM